MGHHISPLIITAVAYLYIISTGVAAQAQNPWASRTTTTVKRTAADSLTLQFILNRYALDEQPQSLTIELQGGVDYVLRAPEIPILLDPSSTLTITTASTDGPIATIYLTECSDTLFNIMGGNLLFHGIQLDGSRCDKGELVDSLLVLDNPGSSLIFKHSAISRFRLSPTAASFLTIRAGSIDMEKVTIKENTIIGVKGNDIVDWDESALLGIEPPLEGMNGEVVVTITECTFTSNIMRGNGAHLIASIDATDDTNPQVQVLIDHSDFKANRIEGDGALLFAGIEAAYTQLSWCTFTSNTIDGGPHRTHSGMIHSGHHGGMVQLDSVDFSGNSMMHGASLLVGASRNHTMSLSHTNAFYNHLEGGSFAFRGHMNIDGAVLSFNSLVGKSSLMDMYDGSSADGVMAHNNTFISAALITISGYPDSTSLTDLKLMANRGSGHADLLVVNDGEARLTSAKIEGNEVGNSGHLVYVEHHSALAMESMTITGNSAASKGGIFMATSTIAGISSSDFSSEKDGEKFIDNHAGELQLTNCSFKGPTQRAYGEIITTGSRASTKIADCRILHPDGGQDTQVANEVITGSPSNIRHRNSHQTDRVRYSRTGQDVLVKKRPSKLLAWKTLLVVAGGLIVLYLCLNWSSLFSEMDDIYSGKRHNDISFFSTFTSGFTQATPNIHFQFRSKANRPKAY